MVNVTQGRVACTSRLHIRKWIEWALMSEFVAVDFGCSWVNTWVGRDSMLQTDAIQITPEFLALISETDEFKGAWRAFRTLAPERLNALRRVATIESVGSSTRIEGSKLSDRDVERLLSDLRIQSFATREEQEVAGYAKVMETVFESWADIPITENHIKQLHRDLLSYSDKDDYHRGAYKTTSNSVAAFDEAGRQIGIVFETATPFDTPRLMTELVAWLNEARDGGRLHPLLIIGVFIVVFLEIHPFQDGNGRLSRILTTILLLQAGYAYVQAGIGRTSHPGKVSWRKPQQQGSRSGRPRKRPAVRCRRGPRLRSWGATFDRAIMRGPTC